MSADFSQAGPFQMMAKPVGAACNLACEYCYYLEKGCGGRCEFMGPEILEKYVREYIEANPWGANFTWHGGEPLAAPVGFYERAMELQRRYSGGTPVENCIQTNGLLLTDEWCEFFARNDWLVGISLDGPEDVHDRYRKTRGKSGSFKRALKGVGLLKKHGVRWNAMAAVTERCARRPGEFYDFFRSIDCAFLQFTPVVERFLKDGSGRLASLDEDGEIAEFSVSPKSWGAFLTGVFDRWVGRDVGRVFIQTFEATLANWLNLTPGVCSLSGSCAGNGVISPNGDVYSCDHFVFGRYKIGNICERTLGDMMASEAQSSFGRMKTELLPSQCRKCEFYFACRGECPRNRFCKSQSGEVHLNRLCDGYRQYFRHAKPYMDYMKAEYLAGRPLDSVMGVRF